MVLEGIMAKFFPAPSNLRGAPGAYLLDRYHLGAAPGSEALASAVLVSMPPRPTAMLLATAPTECAPSGVALSFLSGAHAEEHCQIRQPLQDWRKGVRFLYKVVPPSNCSSSTDALLAIDPNAAIATGIHGHLT